MTEEERNLLEEHRAAGNMNEDVGHILPSKKGIVAARKAAKTARDTVRRAQTNRTRKSI